MKKILSILSIAALVLSLGACTMTSSVDLAAVAKASNMKNITTGDGTFENYTAVGEFKGKEIGFGIGLPFLKIFEIGHYAQKLVVMRLRFVFGGLDLRGHLVGRGLFRG